MQMLAAIKAFDPATLTSVDEMVLMHSTATSMISTYSSLNGEAPEWLKDREKALRKEIGLRMHDELERQLKELRAKEESLRSREEQRKDIEERRKALEAKLAPGKS